MMTMMMRVTREENDRGLPVYFVCFFFGGHPSYLSSLPGKPSRGHRRCPLPSPPPQRYAYTCLSSSSSRRGDYLASLLLLLLLVEFLRIFVNLPTQSSSFIRWPWALFGFVPGINSSLLAKNNATFSF